jgi:hypothetical protein
MRQLGTHLVLRRLVERLDLVLAAPRRDPGERQRPELGEAAGGGGVGIDQRLDIGGGQPQIGERLQALARGDRLREEDAVDPARRRAGDDVGEDAQLDPGERLDLFDQRGIDRLAATRRRVAGMKGAAGADQMPHLLGDAVHIDREADPAVADQREPQFLLAHQAGASVAQIGR